jgi:hypothetical protein
MEYIELIFPPANPIQNYALVFLLGSLTVSSLSDLRRLAAQADFAEIWGAFTAVMFAADVYTGLTGELNLLAFTLKWALILTAVVFTSTVHLLNISTMDVAALAALMSTLTPAYIILTLFLTVIVNELLHPILRNYGEAGAYPFLPTVLAVNLLLLLILLNGGIEPYLGIATENLITT